MSTPSPRDAGHRARKRFGQNFLRDGQVVERMIAALAPARDDAVVEVGPGLGALTWPLLERLDALTVVELDRDLIARLETRAAAIGAARATTSGTAAGTALGTAETGARDPSGGPDPAEGAAPVLRIVAGDVLGVDLAALAPGRSLRVIGNLPYNIGTPLILRLVDVHAAVADVHVMLQKEVVDRLAAVPGTRAYGRLSVIVQSVFDVTPLFGVPPGAFEPPPKVHSAVCRLVPRADAPAPDALDALSRATRLAFAGKRKTLRNNLRGHLEPDTIEALGIDPQARAETLDGAAFARLARALLP